MQLSSLKASTCPLGATHHHPGLHSLPLLHTLTPLRVDPRHLRVYRNSASSGAAGSQPSPVTIPPIYSSDPALYYAHEAIPPTPSPLSPICQFFASEELLDELKDPSTGVPVNAVVLLEVATLLLIAFPPLQIRGFVPLVGALLLAAGLALSVLALLSLGRNFSPLTTPRKHHELVDTGVYELMRHPLFTGVLVLALGISVITLSETRLALTLLLGFILDRKALFEEEALTARYPEYLEYQKRVHKYIPFL